MGSFRISFVRAALFPINGQIMLNPSCCCEFAKYKRAFHRSIKSSQRFNALFWTPFQKFKLRRFDALIKNLSIWNRTCAHKNERFNSIKRIRYYSVWRVFSINGVIYGAHFPKRRIFWHKDNLFLLVNPVWSIANAHCITAERSMVYEVALLISFLFLSPRPNNNGNK